MGRTRITADWKGRVDEYTNTPHHKTTVRYYADEEDKDYFYEMYVRVDGKLARVIVTPHGVSVDFHESRETIHTNLVPMRMFPGVEKLEWDNLNEILIVLRRTGIEGKTYSKEEMDAKYQQFLEETGYKEEDE